MAHAEYSGATAPKCGRRPGRRRRFSKHLNATATAGRYHNGGGRGKPKKPARLPARRRQSARAMPGLETCECWRCYFVARRTRQLSRSARRSPIRRRPIGLLMNSTSCPRCGAVDCSPFTRRCCGAAGDDNARPRPRDAGRLRRAGNPRRRTACRARCTGGPHLAFPDGRDCPRS